MTSRTFATNQRSPDHRSVASVKRLPYGIFHRLRSPSGLRYGSTVSQASQVDHISGGHVSGNHFPGDHVSGADKPVAQTPRQPSPPLRHQHVTTSPVEASLECDSQLATLTSNTSPLVPPPPPPPPPPEVTGAAMLGLKSSKFKIGSSRAQEREPPQHNSMQKQVAARNAVAMPNMLLGFQGHTLQLVRGTIKTQEKIVKKRLSVVGHKRDLKSQVSHYVAANEDFDALWDELLPALEKSNLDPALRSRFLQARQKSERLSTTVKKWQHLIDADEDADILRLDSRYLNQMTELSKCLQDFIPQAEMDRDPFLSDLSGEHFQTRSRPASLFSSSSTSTISVRRRYLKTIGTINLLRERLFNWKADLYLEMDQREFDREDGLQLESSDEDFFAGFKHRYHAIVDKYWTTKEEMAQTYQACLDQDLEPPPANLPLFLDQLFTQNDELLMEPGVKNKSSMESELSRKILQWARHVDNVGRSGALEPATDLGIAPETGLDDNMERESTGEDRRTVGASVASVSSASQGTPSFPGEVPKDRRRYSAPMILQRTGRSENLASFDYQGAKIWRTQERMRGSKFGLRRANSVHSQE